MPNPATTRPQAQPTRQAPAAAVPFFDGTYPYSEVIQTLTLTPGTVTQDFSVNITPGGFLKGVSIYVSGAGGTLGTGVLSADSPFNLFQMLTLESIDGTPINYPMGGYAYYLDQRYTKYWQLDPAKDPAFVNSINPVFRMNFFNEVRATAGVLPNTDARAQYRLRGTLNTLANWLSTVGTATAPTLTITIALEIYAQPPSRTLTGVPIQQIPDGLAVQRFLSHQIDVLNTGDNTIKLNRVGNKIRTLILVVRDVNGNHFELTQDPIRFRVDNTQMFVEQRQRRDFQMAQQFAWNTQSARPAGVYVYSNVENKGDMTGKGWLETAEATFLQFELLGGPAGGTLETITEDLALTAQIPGYLENI